MNVGSLQQLLSFYGLQNSNSFGNSVNLSDYNLFGQNQNLYGCGDSYGTGYGSNYNSNFGFCFPQQNNFFQLIMMLIQMLQGGCGHHHKPDPEPIPEPPTPVIPPLPEGPKKATTNTENYLCAERGADKDRNGTDINELKKYKEAEKKQIADLEDILTREYHEPDELKQLQSKLQWHRQQLLVAERMESNFANLDKNRDGKIAYEEILEVAKRDGDVKTLSNLDFLTRLICK